MTDGFTIVGRASVAHARGTTSRTVTDSATADLAVALPLTSDVARRRVVADTLGRFRQVPGALSDDASREVRLLLATIHSRLFDPNLCVKTLKAQCRLRDNNVSCRFRCETGLYLHTYIARLRVEAAAALLALAELSIAEVARMVGYTHLQTFYRVFRERFGCTPAHYRHTRAGIGGGTPDPAVAVRRAPSLVTRLVAVPVIADAD